MTWTPETSCGFESDKIAHLIVPYTRGKGLDIGCGMRRAWPHFIGIDNGHHFGQQSDATIQGDGTDLSLFSDASLDFVFSSHALEHFPRDKVPGILEEWARVLKVGGHLVLYIPSGNLYPRCGEAGANPDHKWDPMPGDVEAILSETVVSKDYGWTQLEREERDQGNEYSLFLVFRKTEGAQVLTEQIWERNPGGKKRCLVIRYGAIGDQIQAASILPGLKKQGYHVTYSTTPDSQQVLFHDPHIDDWLLQDKDQVPNIQLGPYWEALKERYDHIVNLSESIEGTLLPLPGRLQHQYCDDARRRLMGTKNYLEQTHDIAGVPHEFSARFYATDHEKAWAKTTKNLMAKGAPVILWAVTGSSIHKTYPWVDIVTRWLLEQTPAHIVFTGDRNHAKELQDGILATLKEDGVRLDRVHAMCGKWTIRQTLSFAQTADCVVGPETGVLNAVGLETVPKVIYLSHSSHENLTKHWINTVVVTPDREKAPCYPCHRMHYDWTFCHKDEQTSAALCASAIGPMRLLQAIATSVGIRQAA